MKPKFIDRVFNAIFRSRFEPIETVLALSAVLHGAWLTAPYWILGGGVEITPAPRAFELLVGGALGLLGATHLLALYFRRARLRRHVAFFKFIMWLFFTGLAYITAGPDSIIWIGYLTISLTSAVVYLNISVRDIE